jgi:hypothetical protein
MPEMTATDMSTVANTMSAVAGANVVAEEQGWQPRETSREIWAKVVSELGVEIDLSEEMAGPEQPAFGDQGRPVGERAAVHGIAWDGSGETGQPRPWSGLTPTEQQELVASIMERIGMKVNLDDVAEALTVMENARQRVEAR